MARRKQEALDVPANAEEATALLRSYVDTEHAVLSLRLAAEQRIAVIERDRDDVLANVLPEQDRRFRALKAWWEAGGNQLAGRLRSIELEGVKIGIRLTPPFVKFARGVKAKAVVTWLQSLSWPEARKFLRTKVDLDKQAVVKAVPADKQIAARFEDWLAVEQSDEFFIDAGLDEEAMRKALADG